MALRITHDTMTLQIDNHVVATAGSASTPRPTAAARGSVGSAPWMPRTASAPGPVLRVKR